MVVFTCSHCGESLQKQKVAKHYQFQCRNAISLTCVDCLKDFLNDEYIAHTKCVTEAERYGGKDYVAKPSSNKGERKQQEWINIVNNILNSSENLSKDERNFLQSISKYQNIPRKKAKYLNFVKNALGYRINFNIVDSCWEKMESTYKKLTAQQKSNNNKSKNNSDTKINDNSNNGNINEDNNLDINNSAEKHSNTESLTNGKNKKVLEVTENVLDNGKSEIEEKTKKKKKKNQGDNENHEVVVNKSKSKKRKLGNSQNNLENDSVEEPSSKINRLEDAPEVDRKKKKIIKDEKLTENGATVEKTDKFDWTLEIRNIVEAKCEVTLKKLKKKIVGKYLSNNPHVINEKADSKFTKKLNKMSDLLVIDNNKVKLKL